jgi:hypothetical protein
LPRQAANERQAAKQRFSNWLDQHYRAKINSQAEALPLRRDMVTLLTFVRDNRVVGTQSTGNMPLKSVRKVTARFVNPPQLDHTIGDHTYKLRTEADVWPLYFLHILAEVSGLLEIAPARRWRLTPEAESFLTLDPLLQVSFLLTVWWYQVNWLVAYPFEGMGEELPYVFESVTLVQLRSLATETAISFEGFADGLIEKTGLTWTAPDSSAATMLLRSSIARMVIDILADFGAAKREYREEPLGKGTISHLDAFEITQFGKALLEAVATV